MAGDKSGVKRGGHPGTIANLASESTLKNEKAEWRRGTTGMGYVPVTPAGNGCKRATGDAERLEAAISPHFDTFWTKWRRAGSNRQPRGSYSNPKNTKKLVLLTVAGDSTPAIGICRPFAFNPGFSQENAVVLPATPVVYRIALEPQAVATA
jgi:hypothetical protein